MKIVPLTLSEANDLVTAWHRHNSRVTGAKFCLGAVKNSFIVGAAIVGRPVARHLDNGTTLEVNRCVTDGTKNACSALYGAVARSAKALGYERVFTYIRDDENGASLKASGWVMDGKTPPGSWDVPSRRRVDKTDIIGRKRFVFVTGNIAPQWNWPKIERQGAVDLFAVGADE